MIRRKGAAPRARLYKILYVNKDIKTTELENINKVIYKDYIKTDSEHIQVCEMSEMSVNDDSNIIDMSIVNSENKSWEKIYIKTSTLICLLNSTIVYIIYNVYKYINN